MNAWVVLRLMDKYGECPKCGNALLGNGEGTLNITDDCFTRTCKCGWQVTVKEGDST